MVDLSHKHVLVVGGSRGIGRSAAILAAELGANVSLTYDSNRIAAEETVQRVRGFGRRSCAEAANVADENAMKLAIQTCAERLGPIDGLVVSAGIFEGSEIDKMTVEFWDRTMAINVRGTFLSVKHSLAHMRNGAGSIVIITSTAGQRGSAVYSAYATSKGAQIMFMRSMAKELAPSIRVNCVAPAWTETDMADASLTALGREDVAAGFPLGRIGQPDDVAKGIVFLLSEAAGFITGTTMTIDGGSDMRG